MGDRVMDAQNSLMSEGSEGFSGRKVTVVQSEAGGGCVILLAMFCWDALGPVIRVDVTLTNTTYLNGYRQYSLMTVPSFGRIMNPVTPQTMFTNGLRNMTKFEVVTWHPNPQC